MSQRRLRQEGDNGLLVFVVCRNSRVELFKSSGLLCVC
jgi:hypothetical protein